MDLLAGGQADLLDAAVRGAGDGAVKVAPDELIAHLGQTAQFLLDQTADGDGVNVVVLLDAQLVGGVVNTGAAGNQPAAVGLLTTSSCSSQISPTSSSRISSSVMMPAVPPYSSTTTAMWCLLSRRVRSSAEIWVTLVV